MEQALRTLLENMILGLQKQVEAKVPEKGKFDVVYERKDVSEMRLGLSHIILKVTVPDFSGDDDKRFLDLGAVNYPSPYAAACTIKYGTTQDILDRLHEDGLVDVLVEKVKYLSNEIYYDERHPYG